MNKLLEGYYKELELTMASRAAMSNFLSRSKSLLAASETSLGDDVVGAIDLGIGVAGAVAGGFFSSTMDGFTRSRSKKRNNREIVSKNQLLKKSCCNQNAFSTFVKVENLLDNDDDCTDLINGQCNEIEVELRESICLKTRDILAENILNSYASEKEEKEFLEKFASRELEFTLGAIKHWISGIEKCLRYNDEDVMNWFNSTFDESYLEYLTMKKLSAFISRLSNRYRNPAAHRRKHFLKEPHYSKFCGYIYGQDSLYQWCISHAENSNGGFNRYLTNKLT